MGQFPNTTVPDRPTGPANYLALLIRRARMEGFLVMDYFDRAESAIEDLVGWIGDGKISYRETIVEGIDTFPATFGRLFTGEKLGKLALKVS